MSMDMNANRIMGGIGALLMVIGALCFFVNSLAGGLLMLIGVILVLIALKGFADYYNEHGIFTNALYGTVLHIVGVVVFIIIVVIAALGFFASIGISPEDLTNLAVVQQIDWSELIDFNTILPFLWTMLGGFFILFIFVVVSAFFIKKSLTILGEKTGLTLFKMTGLVTLIGAFLTIILIGFIILIIALILLTVSFFLLKTPPAPTQPPTVGMQ